MKRFLLLYLGCLFAIIARAQAPVHDFTIQYNGVTLYYQITDPVKRYVRFTSRLAYYTPGYNTLTTFPARVTNPLTNIEYEVKSSDAQFFNQTSQEFWVPEGVERIEGQSFLFSAFKRLYLPTTLNYIENMGEYFGEKIIGLEHTKIEEFPGGLFNQSYSLKQDWVFPPTLKKIGYGALIYDNTDEEITFPALLNTISIDPWYGSDHPGMPQLVPKYKKATFLNPTPATVTTKPIAMGTNTMASLLGTQVTTVMVPIDATHAYETHADWSYFTGKYREEVKIGASGYATLYLATENFKVPTGCDAFVIENITKATTPGGLDKANAKKFVAGDIIPAAQAVILRGTAGQTYEYQANVSGTPVTITDNMLVGTATDQTINATGYEYYLFGNGALGQGFYRQTGHDKSSISLKAHKAGLRVPKGGGGSAKAFVIDFDAADTYVPTGIQSVKTPQPQSDVIYDLQGRRVTHPTRGIYIMNGKKMVFN